MKIWMGKDERNLRGLADDKPQLPADCVVLE